MFFSKFINSDCARAGRVCMHRLPLEHPECILCSPHSLLLCLFFIIPSKKQWLTPSVIMYFLWLHLCTVGGDFKLERWHSQNSFHKLEALLAAGSVGARKWGPEQDPTKGEESGGKWGNKRERKGENRREKVWEIWVKRTVYRRVRVGAGVDHPHHMFYSVLQRGWLWAKHSQHTRPHALPDGLIFTALQPLKP